MGIHISGKMESFILKRGSWHYDDIIMSTMASQITSPAIVYSTVYSGTDERKHQGSASLAFVRGIHRWPVNSPHKSPVTRKMFPFDDVIMVISRSGQIHYCRRPCCCHPHSPHRHRHPLREAPTARQETVGSHEQHHLGNHAQDRQRLRHPSGDC